MKNKFNSEMKKLRENLLKEIYDGKFLSEAELNLADLCMYSKNNTFFAILNKAVNSSILDNNITLTDEQVECLNILNENNLFLSAPTSFGKTFIALEYIAKNKQMLNNIIFVVPTIALMNELRKKCYNYFSEEYIIITSDAELEQYKYETKKIIIVVPERISTTKFKLYLENNSIDFLIYDEIYKLKYDKNERDTNDRIIKMNYIYKYLIDKSSRILLLGPFIKNVTFEKSNLKIEKYITNLNLVYNTINFELFDSLKVLENLEDKKIVYFKTPNNIRKFLSNDLEGCEVYNCKHDEEIVEWISHNIHAEWYYSKYLKRGIGIHHGKTPIFLRKYIEYEYSKKDGFIHTILCTSTLMEGINTPTNKLIIYDAPIGTFELNNLIGRVGRLNPQKPKKGEIHVIDKQTFDLYNPEQWIELNILYETDEILTKSQEDEVLYLDKKSKDGIPEEKIKTLKTELVETFGIGISEVVEAGIEFNLLMGFINNFETIINHTKEWGVIHDIKFKLLNSENTYMQGLLLKTYSFSDEDGYIFDAVYLLLVSGGKMKPVIDRFEREYNANVNDINLFIDTLFQIDEFIKFKMMKIVNLYELFNKKQLFHKSKNRAFIQSVHMIESYFDSPDGYDRILADMGIPKEDIIEISNTISKYEGVKGTERKLQKLKTEKIFNALSPFSKRIIRDL